VTGEYRGTVIVLILAPWQESASFIAAIGPGGVIAGIVQSGLGEETACTEQGDY
jgi:hypothetical protein